MSGASEHARKAAEAIKALFDAALGVVVDKPTPAADQHIAEIIDRLAVSPAVEEKDRLLAAGIHAMDAERARADRLAEALTAADECLNRAEGAAEHLPGKDGRSVREAIDDASETVARALKGHGKGGADAR